MSHIYYVTLHVVIKNTTLEAGLFRDSLNDFLCSKLFRNAFPFFKCRNRMRNESMLLPS